MTEQLSTSSHCHGSIRGEVVQVIMPPIAQLRYRAWLAERGLALAQLPAPVTDDDLPTFIITPTDDIISTDVRDDVVLAVDAALTVLEPALIHIDLDVPNLTRCVTALITQMVMTELNK